MVPIGFRGTACIAVAAMKPVQMNSRSFVDSAITVVVQVVHHLCLNTKVTRAGRARLPWIDATIPTAQRFEHGLRIVWQRGFDVFEARGSEGDTAVSRVLIERPAHDALHSGGARHVSSDPLP